ncbi:restriction endonuclease subunit S [Paenibacillus sp. UMB7766-LJ446]|uniref:restriction endonuclease subunit S n=1 Tax=Paenibacillus sp. UMB7766-LJ446 TaxID=3046313 RepID=UPI0025518A29|nr:restriction endonuclease subunit S [Paenibacillus sp. UMB7766-LJ446]MDK8191812.1 restriction endonuclease subunit S [Paenibacillus sp. UMB7766-LJ446]
MKELDHNSKNYSGEEWIGDVPTNWDVKPLFTLFRNIQNKNIGNLENNVLSLSYGKIVRRDIESNYGLLPESFETYQIVEPNDIILRLTDLQNDKKSLRVGLVEERGIITSAYVSLRPGNKLLPRYAYYLLHNYDISKIFYNLGSGVRQSMNYVDLKKLTFLVPPLMEQSRIVVYLDSEISKINLLISKKKKLVELLQEKRQAFITEAVTKGLAKNVPMKDSGIEWLGNVPAHWRISKFKYISKLTSGGTPKRNNNVDYFENGDIDWVRTLDLTEDSVFDTSEKLTEEALMNSNCKMLPVNTLLIAMYGGGGTIGKSGILEIESTTNQAIASILPNEKYFYPRYLLRVLNFLRPHWMIYAEGSRKDPNINLDVVANMPLPLPPINEQKKISLFLEKKLISLANIELKIIKQIKQLQEYRQSLISEAVTGKIDIGE